MSKTEPTDLTTLLDQARARHNHLCPRQVLGVRIGLAGADALGIDVPLRQKNMLVLVETDGCFVSGVEVATGASVHRRTLRVVDYGKIAATFVDVASGRAVRIAPRRDVRERAWDYAKAGETRRYFAMLRGYQAMPLDELLHVEPVELTTPVAALISRAGARVDCARCGEEVINEREVVRSGKALCRACAGNGYYTSLDARGVS